jgi:plastocyanin
MTLIITTTTMIAGVAIIAIAVVFTAAAAVGSKGVVTVTLGQEALAQEQQEFVNMTGQQFYENGTGTAHFSDGSTIGFNHSITPGNGFYYDNSSIFVAGEIPGYEINDTITGLNNQNHTTGDIINVTIVSGAAFLGNRSIYPSTIINASVGDIITFTNDDVTTHIIRSPPSDPNPQVAAGMNFDFWLFPGQSYSLVMTRPGVGQHYELLGDDIKGAVIVEKQ